ncbi:hypothetical protein GCM10012286_41950 [Streptomyces lasiicapitis]|uniref:Uncharacterized protein n=1 Tax=Streptomyces lasiicapitis TaxID=1923961 RepID=A0ABQ2M7P6_9ACTN|nr:hypothetical protein GCM10012286_41950 [Streptomyces lasiicapitis]
MAGTAGGRPGGALTRRASAEQPGPPYLGSAENPVRPPPRTPTVQGVQIYEIHIRGCAGTDAALALQEPLARLLCPVEDHEGPCEVPWGFTLRDERAEEGEAGPERVLVLGIFASAEQAAEVVDRVRAFVGAAHPVVLGEAATDTFDELADQYRIEQGLGPDPA